MALDQTKRRLGRLKRQIARTNETQAKRKDEVSKLQTKLKSAK